jgi:Domain of unknown function (DUF4396)
VVGLIAAGLFQRGHEIPVATWLVVLADVSLCLAGLSAALLIYDIVASRRQMMTVMKWVWPITALYMGPFAILAYRKFQLEPMLAAMRSPKGAGPGAMAAREDQAGSSQAAHHQMMREMTAHKPFWAQVFTGVTHCGAGCTLGDIAGEFLVFGLGATLLGTLLWNELFADYVLAYLLGIAFQYFSIAPMRGISGLQGVWAAMKADTLSLTAFEVGLFGWMILYSIVIFHGGLHPNSPVYWFMMQIGMVLGFATSYPVNWWLLRSGIKEPM